MDTLKIEIANSAKGQNNGQGIGLENLRSQLNHLYRNDFELFINNAEDSFTVNLTLKNQL
jgi:sensor histidine kinase YesM